MTGLTCGALRHPDDPTTPCGEAARLYPAGFRCDTHRPGAARPQPKESTGVIVDRR